MFGEGRIEADAFMWLQGFAALSGMLVVAGVAEKKLGRHLAGFVSTRAVWAVMAAFLAYFARAAAVDDVNAVFHVDASALPMAVLAGTVMHLFSWLRLPFLAVCLVSAFAIVGMLRGTQWDERTGEGEKFALFVIALMSLFVCGIGAAFISAQLDEGGRRQKLYRIAHATDFSGTFRCAGVDDRAYSVLFIGPDQRRALVAPKVPPPSLFGQRTHEFLRSLRYPGEFPVVECVPSVDAARWAAEIRDSRKTD